MSKDNIIDLSSKTDNCRHHPLHKALMDVLESLNPGGSWESATGIIVLGVNKTGDAYDWFMNRAGLSHTDCILLFEIAKNTFIHEMKGEK